MSAPDFPTTDTRKEFEDMVPVSLPVALVALLLYPILKLFK